MAFSQHGNGGDAHGGGTGGVGVNMPNPRVIKFFVAFILFFVLLAILSKASGGLVDWLWMIELGYSPLFLRLIWIKVLLFAVAAAFVFLYLWINLKIAAGRQKAGFIQYQGEDMADVYELRVGARPAGIIAIVMAVVPALIFALGISSAWDTFLRYLWGGAFGRVDPLFGRDIGFYIFKLPAYEAIQGSLSGITFLAIPITFVGYLLYRQVRLAPDSLKNTRMFVHLSLLFVIFLAVWGTGHYLSIFGLLYEKRGAVFGAGYTDYHVVRVCLWIMAGATALLAAVVLWNLKQRAIKTVLVGVGGYIVMMVIVLGILPAIIQSYVVQPNELSLEKPFLEHNIALTTAGIPARQGRGAPLLRHATTFPPPLSSRKSGHAEKCPPLGLEAHPPDLQADAGDAALLPFFPGGRRPLPTAGRRIQAGDDIRSGAERPGVAAGARRGSTSTSNSPMVTASPWATYRRSRRKAFPAWSLKTSRPNRTLIKIDQPVHLLRRKYEPATPSCRTGVEEFDYPKGDKNVYTSYSGTGGIPIGSFWRRLLFAWELMDSNILISSYIKPESQGTALQDGARAGRPHRSLFSPSIPTHTSWCAGGRLFWIQDCYTTPPAIPYSDPYSDRLNYIRNSVKAVVDAYNGSVSFYMSDPDDPVLACLRPRISRHFHASSEDARRPGRAHKVSRGHIPHPDGQAHDLPHDGPEGLLQQGRRLGPAHPEVRGQNHHRWTRTTPSSGFPASRTCSSSSCCP